METSIKIRGSDAGIFTLNSVIWVPNELSAVFDFFSDARNLEKLTPPWLSFQVLNKDDLRMEEGLKIDYWLKIHGVPVRWQSEISVWEPPTRFVDEQRRGPYRLWHHEHIFTPRNGGTEVRDLVHYAVPGGTLVHDLFVKRDVRRIFEYRRGKLASEVAGLSTNALR